MPRRRANSSPVAAGYYDFGKGTRSVGPANAASNKASCAKQSRSITGGAFGVRKRDAVAHCEHAYPSEVAPVRLNAAPAALHGV